MLKLGRPVDKFFDIHSKLFSQRQKLGEEEGQMDRKWEKEREWHRKKERR